MKLLTLSVLPLLIAAGFAYAASPEETEGEYGLTPQKSNAHAYQERVLIKNVVFSPSSGTIMVQFSQTTPENVTLSLFDAEGHFLSAKTENGKKSGIVFFDGANLQSGTYLVKLGNDDRSVVKAVIIVR
jgi:hypothetical protein